MPLRYLARYEVADQETIAGIDGQHSATLRLCIERDPLEKSFFVGRRCGATHSHPPFARQALFELATMAGEIGGIARGFDVEGAVGSSPHEFEFAGLGRGAYLALQTFSVSRKKPDHPYADIGSAVCRG